MKVKIIYIIFIFSVTFESFCQDIHFSQFTSTPLSLNPATSGSFKGNFRLSSNYKNQWNNISQTYNTAYLSGDVALFKNKINGSYLGLGILFYNDKAGKTTITTNQSIISVAYNLKINKFNHFAVGIGVGFFQNSLNTTNLKWDNQFNGYNYDPGLNTGETFIINHSIALDASCGVLWNITPNEKNYFTIGISALHVNKPNISFYKNNENYLNPKFAININGEIKTGNNNTFFIPLFLYTYQEKLSELNLGGMIKYVIGVESKYTHEKKNSFLSAGVTYRNKDAIIILLSLDYKSSLKFGFSYDINTSKLIKATKGRGGLELSIIYIGQFKN